jgi:hypothetical protein
MNQALGMIETKGLVALIEATDAMLKAANVTFGVGYGFRGRRCRSRQSGHGRRRGSCGALGRSGQRAGDCEPARGPRRLHGAARQDTQEVETCGEAIKRLTRREL